MWLIGQDKGPINSACTKVFYSKS